MTSPRTLGSAHRPTGPVLTAVAVELHALDLVVQWQRCGIAADYVAEHLALSFAHHATARSVLSTVANELLENAAKFCADKTESIRLSARHMGEVIELVTRNGAEAKDVSALEHVFAELAGGDLDAAFARRIEAKSRGGLGLLILAKDYAVQLGADLAPAAAPGRTDVTLRAVLSTQQLEQA